MQPNTLEQRLKEVPNGTYADHRQPEIRCQVPIGTVVPPTSVTYVHLRSDGRTESPQRPVATIRYSSVTRSGIWPLWIRGSGPPRRVRAKGSECRSAGTNGRRSSDRARGRDRI